KPVAEVRPPIKCVAGQDTVVLSAHLPPEVSVGCRGLIILNNGPIGAPGPIDTLREEFLPTARVEVEIVGPAPAVRERIRAIAGVLSVQDVAGANGAGRFVVEAARDRDVRSEIFRMAAQQRWELLELKRGGMTLEGVFIRIVAGEESEEAPRS